MGQIFRNDFSTTLTATITTASTALALTAAPSPAIVLTESDDFFKLTLVDENGNREIVKCVGISGLDVTIGVALGVPSVDGRAQENTTAIPITHTDDHIISMRTTAGLFETIIAAINTLQANTSVATIAMAEEGTDDVHPLSPLKGRVMVDGYAPLATLVQAQGGTNNIARMSPLRSRQSAEAAYGGIFESGTTCIFKQNTVPTGWVFLAEDNDRVFMGTDSYTEGGSTGGSWTLSGISVNGHALTLPESPPHKHGIDVRWHDVGTSGTVRNADWGGAVMDTETKSAGGGLAHSHGITLGNSWRPAYVKAITARRL